MNVITINVRGLNTPSKRKTLFHWLDTKCFTIICLQETFCTAERVKEYTSDCTGSSYHCLSDSRHSRGVSILLNKSFEYTINNYHTTNDGRLILLNLVHNGQTYSIVNIYAPNEANHRKDFFSK